jgi:hypothetical protein
MTELSKFAVIIPCCAKDTKDMLLNLGLWLTDNHKIGDENEISESVDLVLYYCAASQTDHISQAVVKKAETFDKYFKNIYTKQVILSPSEYKYPSGPGIMFFKNMRETPYDVFFYMEPDCLPVKNNWLPHLIKNFKLCIEDDLWVRGTLYGGYVGNNDVVMKMHFNGNSIYSPRTKDARDFFEKVRSKITISLNYDTQIMRYLHSQVAQEDLRDYLFHSKYSRMVLNFGKQPIPPKYIGSQPAETYFLHGQNYINIFRHR